MVIRIYTYRLTPPGDALTLATAIKAAGDHVVKHSKHVQKVETFADGEDMLIKLTVQGLDQWMIKKQVVYPVAGILTKCGIKVRDVRLDAVDKPPEVRGSYKRAASGTKPAPHPDDMIDHTDMGLDA
jgi:hypothetical protein